LFGPGSRSLNEGGNRADRLADRKIYERPTNAFVAGLRVGPCRTCSSETAKRITVRRKKIFFVENGEAPKRTFMSRRGTEIKDVSYAGMDDHAISPSISKAGGEELPNRPPEPGKTTSARRSRPRRGRKV